MCDFPHTHTHEDTRGSGRRAATTMPMLRAVTSTRELDDAVPVLHEDVAHAPQPQPRVEALSCRRPARTKSSIACVPAACPNQIEYCVRAGGLPEPNRVLRAGGLPPNRVLTKNAGGLPEPNRVWAAASSLSWSSSSMPSASARRHRGRSCRKRPARLARPSSPARSSRPSP